MIPGPRADWFTARALRDLATRAYRVSAASNRIGLRTEGPALERARPGELPSEGMVLGAVQVPPDGRPVVFLADHPTTGGYPVIAVVRAADLPAAAQAAWHPGPVRAGCAAAESAAVPSATAPGTRDGAPLSGPPCRPGRGAARPRRPGRPRRPRLGLPPPRRPRRGPPRPFDGPRLKDPHVQGRPREGVCRKGVCRLGQRRRRPPAGDASAAETAADARRSRWAPAPRARWCSSSAARRS